jgi:hypothetical protein
MKFKVALSLILISFSAQKEGIAQFDREVHSPNAKYHKYIFETPNSFVFAHVGFSNPQSV